MELALHTAAEVVNSRAGAVDELRIVWTMADLVAMTTDEYSHIHAELHAAIDRAMARGLFSRVESIDDPYTKTLGIRLIR